jgi:Ser/Thr protein kinase RdoA (MazF antagonist)
MSLMLELFEPDIFSIAEPQFHPVNAETAAIVCEILRDRYLGSQSRIGDIAQIGAIEINSNNFRIDIDDKLFLFKRSGIAAKVKTLTEQFAVSEKLRDLGIPFPRIVRNRANESMTISGDARGWILTEFVSGSYYSGDKIELGEVGSKIGQLFAALHLIDTQELPLNATIDTTSDIRQSIDRLFASQGRWHELFPPKDAGLLINSGMLLEETAALVSESLPRLASLPCAPCHIDLHPHNILINSGKIAAFVDVESLQVNTRAVAIAFAIFKLVRQHAIRDSHANSNHSEISRAAKNFFKSINEHLLMRDEECLNLSKCALFEVLRRVLIITNLNIMHQNTDWNKVLPIQLAALREIPIIFAKLI